MGEPEGTVKTIFDKATGELLGAYIFDVEVTDMIQGYTIACILNTMETDLRHTVFSHPGVSGTTHEAMFGAYGRDVRLDNVVNNCHSMRMSG